MLQVATPHSHVHLERMVTRLVYVGARNVCLVLGVNIATDLVSLNQLGSVKLGSTADLGLLSLLRLMGSQEMFVPGVASALRAQQSRLIALLERMAILLGIGERRIASHVTQGGCITYVCVCPCL